MALGDGGLDAQVEQRMDAYRGDPQKLQQRYGQNKELLDLLALQKLTAEKKQVAADMQLKAQQNPNTIAQQREQEALELVKQEMGGTLGQLAANTKSTLDQKQALQQKNMGRLAQNASRPQPGPGAGLAGLMGGGARPPARPPVNPQAAGLANARMVQAARGGPIKMAQGGIVSFADGEEVTTPFARGFKKLFSVDPELKEKRELANRVGAKFGSYAGTPGAFTPQTEEVRKYAQEVMSSMRSLPGLMGSGGGFDTTLPLDVLRQLDAIDLDSIASSTDLSTLPVLATSAEGLGVEGSGSAEGGASVEETSTEIDGGGTLASSITYPSTYVNPQDILSEVDTSYEVENASMPPTTELDKAETDLSAAALKTADASLLDVDAPKVAELKPVDAPFSPQDQKRYEAMMNIYADDAMIDPEGAGKAARADADAHLRRAENDADFRRMSAEEKELQARLFSPAQLASEARIATFGGAARGRGGMSAAYTDVMGKQRKDLTDALGRLRGIDEKRISKRDIDVKVTEFVSAFMSEDPRYRALSEQMMKMAGAENSPEFKKLEAQAKVLYEAYMGAMIAVAPDLFGEQEYLRDYIARVKAGTPYSSGSPLPSGTPVISLDDPAPLGIGSLDAASQIR
jgi:hypothetical protein